jgi:hypothetical protein
MTYYNRDNLFNLPPIPKGQQGRQGVTGAKGDEWIFGSSKDWLPGDVGYTNLPGLTGLTNQTSKYLGGVYAPNGKIYCVPSNSDNVLVIDPKGDTYYISSGLTGITGSNKYRGGVLGPNGKVYCIPGSATNVLVIDPIGDTYYYPIGLTGLTNSNKFEGGVLATNGKIYCIPRANPTGDVIVIDPIGDTYYVPAGLTNVTRNNHALCSGVLAQNGLIYSIPVNDLNSNTNILVINPFTDGFTYPAGLTNTTIFYGYFGGVLAPNGKIYATAGTSDRVLVIDPLTNGFTFPSGLTGLSGLTNIAIPVKNVGAVLAPNGKIYCSPYFDNKVLVIDTDTNTYSYPVGLTNIGILNDGNYAGGVCTPNGVIYMIPSNATSVLKIKTGLPKYPNWMLDPYFNKF